MIVPHLLVGLIVVIVSGFGYLIVCDKIIKPKISDISKYIFSYQNVLNYEPKHRGVAPFIITENGTKAVIYTDTEYKKGDRVICVRPDKGEIFCISDKNENNNT